MKCINNIFPEEFNEGECELNSLAYTPLVKDALLKFINKALQFQENPLKLGWRVLHLLELLTFFMTLHKQKSMCTL